MTKGQNLQDILDNVSKDRRQCILERADQLEAEYLALQKLRKSVALSDFIKNPQTDLKDS